MLPVLPYLYVQYVTVVWLCCCFYLARFSFCYLPLWPWLLATSTNCYLCLKYSYNVLYRRKWKRLRFFKRGFMFNLMISFSYGSNLLYLSTKVSGLISCKLGPEFLSYQTVDRNTECWIIFSFYVDEQNEGNFRFCQ